MFQSPTLEGQPCLVHELVVKTDKLKEITKLVQRSADNGKNGAADGKRLAKDGPSSCIEMNMTRQFMMYRCGAKANV